MLPPWHYWLTDQRTDKLTGKRTDKLTVRTTDHWQIDRVILSDWPTLDGWWSLYFCYRIRNSERIFVHKNLLLSLCLVYIVMIFDTFVFTNRKQTPVSFSVVFFYQLAHLPGRGGRGGETLMIVVLSLRGLNHKFWSHWGCSEREVTDLKVNSNFARKSPTFSRGSLLGVNLWKKVCSLGTLRQKHHRKKLFFPFNHWFSLCSLYGINYQSFEYF